MASLSSSGSPRNPSLPSSPPRTSPSMAAETKPIDLPPPSLFQLPGSFFFLLSVIYHYLVINL
ncbi:hypothetical protein OIU79_021164 [Salix purpurea]|uniref:Uncharacterized protein n=1 Tax=Salix purpurea TaxID=77065 RepID=A0A9Q0WNG8_SALPP|nr:hypothetical protein OIU79_021164 [Salix purpurea]